MALLGILAMGKLKAEEVLLCHPLTFRATISDWHFNMNAMQTLLRALCIISIYRWNMSSKGDLSEV